MAKVVIHVNRAMIAANRKDGGHRPVYTAKQGRRTIYAHGFATTGMVIGVDPRAHKQLPCGATAWLEVEGSVTFIDPCSFKEAKAAGYVGT